MLALLLGASTRRPATILLIPTQALPEQLAREAQARLGLGHPIARIRATKTTAKATTPTTNVPRRPRPETVATKLGGRPTSLPVPTTLRLDTTTKRNAGLTVPEQRTSLTRPMGVAATATSRLARTPTDTRRAKVQRVARTTLGAAAATLTASVVQVPTGLPSAPLP